MGGRAVSPGGALLRSSRMFSVPKPLPEPSSTNLHLGDHKSPTMTRQYPQYQSITSPLSSREKGDWGYKRPFPLKSTMTTSTPLIRVKKVDAIESVTDFASAADHSLSLEKFQEMRIAMSIPKSQDRMGDAPRTDFWRKSVFEEDVDFTDYREGKEDGKRWKFQGPWLARMTEGEFLDYLGKKVRPKRAQFRKLLLEKMAEDMTNQAKTVAQAAGKEAPTPVKPSDISPDEFSKNLRAFRNDRVNLYSLVSKFLDLAPLGQPVGIINGLWPGGENAISESPYGKSGPPPSHPSAGISYLRTSSYMENHPIYGPQERRSPILSRVVFPRYGPSLAKLGAGGFVADVPPGDEFQIRIGRHRTGVNKMGRRNLLNGVAQLDTQTVGGAKAYVDPQTASVDPGGRVVLQLREASSESQLIAKEAKGRVEIYTAAETRPQPKQTTKHDESWRLDSVTNEILGEEGRTGGKDVVGSSSAYGLRSQ